MTNGVSLPEQVRCPWTTRLFNTRFVAGPVGKDAMLPDTMLSATRKGHHGVPFDGNIAPNDIASTKGMPPRALNRRAQLAEERC
jgi:hypothetical protein